MRWTVRTDRPRISAISLTVTRNDTLVPQFTKGDRLAKARKTAGIGQQEMAQLLLRDRKTIGNWENDHTEPTPRVLARWAQLTHVPLWWLTDGEPVEDEPASNDRRGGRGTHVSGPLTGRKHPVLTPTAKPQPLVKVAA
jgi:DNA-binding XRE family transcriptional regulator